VSYKVVIKKRLIQEINKLPPKTRRIISETFVKLEENPLPEIKAIKRGWNLKRELLYTCFILEEVILPFTRFKMRNILFLSTSS